MPIRIEASTAEDRLCTTTPKELLDQAAALTEEATGYAALVANGTVR